MVSKIRFKNFKLFKNWQELEIKPITILIGKNNSGKSAVLKLLTMLEGSLNGKFSEALALENDEVRIANEFRDLVYGQAHKSIEFEIFEKKYFYTDEFNFLKTSIYFEDDSPVVEKWNCNNISDLIKIDEDGNYQSNTNNNTYNINFKGINQKDIRFNHDITNYEKELQFPILKLKTDFIGALRQEAKKNYEYSKNISEKSGIDGRKLFDFLIEDSQTTDKKHFNKISDFIKEKFEGWELSIDVDGGRKDKPALIFLKKDNLKINISQTGMGISQVLPLIIRAYKPCKEETCIIVEEPESHLHPYAHAQIAQLFFDSLTLDSNKKYLIETHSQNFVLRMRRLVAEGELKPEDLAIYYIDFDEELNESELNKIKVRKDGSVDFWPEGVFGETIIETRAIMSANINDVRNVD
jgi:predicted ATPase